MKIGILADIHECVRALRWAIGTLTRAGAERLVTLGDLMDTGTRIGETVALLKAARVGGVWGNHDLGLALDPGRYRERYGVEAVDYISGLAPRLEVEGCLFTHGMPCIDPADGTAYYLDPRPEGPGGAALALAASPCGVSFLGHYHRWLAATPGGLLPWEGREPLRLDPGERYLIVVGAVSGGECGLYDTETRVLTPFAHP